MRKNFQTPRGRWSSANLIQAQCDYFAAHTCERIDAKKTLHTEWGEELRLKKTNDQRKE
jgi:6-phosphogluconate dehydrogenase